jgi:hypothetical protein
MPHNDYLKPGGVWGLFSVFTSAIAAQMDQYLFQSINGDLGGTWAPSSFITIGGSGLQVFGPFTATDAQITIPSGKTIVVQTGGTCVMNPGSTFSMNAAMNVGPLGGNIFFHGGSVMQFYDLSGIILNPGTSILAAPGSGIAIASGAQFNAVSGSGVLLAGSTTFPSGASVDQQSGALWNMNGTSSVGGFFTIGATGVLTFVAGSTITGTTNAITWQISGVTTVKGISVFVPAQWTFDVWSWLQVKGLAHFFSGAIIQYDSGTTVQGTITRTASEKRTGSGAYNDERDAFNVPDANVAIDGSAHDVVIFPAAMAATRNYPMVDPAGKVLKVVMTRVIVGSQAHTANVQWPPGTTILSFPNGTDTRGAAILQSDGTDWFAASTQGNAS